VSAVFLDTFGLIALWNDSDQWHSPAQHAYEILRKSRADLVTTRYVLLECGNTIARTDLRAEVTRLRIKLSQQHRLIDPTEDDWNHAWSAFDHGKRGDAGIVDLVSFAVMQRLGIRKALTNDRHFNAAGFETLF
jgi:predicted nucleic acid-binding protein